LDFLDIFFGLFALDSNYCVMVRITVSAPLFDSLLLDAHRWCRRRDDFLHTCLTSWCQKYLLLALRRSYMLIVDTSLLEKSSIAFCG
jgi:hypothetical protein